MWRRRRSEAGACSQIGLILVLLWVRCATLSCISALHTPIEEECILLRARSHMSSEKLRSRSCSHAVLIAGMGEQLKVEMKEYRTDTGLCGVGFNNMCQRLWGGLRWEVFEENGSRVYQMYLSVGGKMQNNYWWKGFQNISWPYYAQTGMNHQEWMEQERMRTTKRGSLRNPSFS